MSQQQYTTQPGLGSPVQAGQTGPGQGGSQQWSGRQETGTGTRQTDRTRASRSGRMGGAEQEQRATRQVRDLRDALPGEMRLTLHDFVQAATVCEWCGDECLEEGPEMAECVRLCRDVADLAIQNVRFMTRGSVFGPDVAETFAYAAEECARECARHPHDHCQECASVLDRAVDSTWDMLDSLQHRPQGTQQQQPY